MLEKGEHGMKGIRIGGLLAVGALVAVSAMPAEAQLTKEEFSCESKTSGALAKFAGAKQKCITKCEQGARKGANPFGDCDSPGYGGGTATCILDAAKGAEAKAKAAIAKGCVKDCPECYSGGSCATQASTQVGIAEAKLDALAGNIYCETVVDKAKNKCSDTLAKSLAKFLGAKSKCYAKCFTGVQKGSIQASECAPPVGDSKTEDCINKAEAKAEAAIEKTCFESPAVAPACYDGSPSRPITGSGWVALVEAVVDPTVPATFCSSPSGAFLD
jgi:hypothetical protein